MLPPSDREKKVLGWEMVYFFVQEGTFSDGRCVGTIDK